jgi:hypothetical protein
VQHPRGERAGRTGTYCCIPPEVRDTPQTQVDSGRLLAGVDAACEQIMQIRDSGAFDGVHLVPVHRYREIAARLEELHPT